MDKMDRNGENKTHRLYWCCSSYALSKLIVDIGLEDLQRRENPDTLRQVLWQGPRIGRVYTDMKIANNTKISHIWYPLLIIIILSLDILPSKTKIGKDSWKRFLKIILFYVIPSSPQLQRLLFLLKAQKTTTLQQVTSGNTPNIVLKRMLRYMLKTPPLKKILQFQERICNLFSKRLVGKHQIYF